MRNYILPFVVVFGMAIGYASPFSDAFQPLKVMDGAASKADFARYRADLLRVIGQRDAEALKSFLSPQIHYSFGVEKPGIAGFYSLWGPAKADSGLWKELAQVVKNGGSFDKNGHFVAPSWYANWPGDREESKWGVVSDRTAKVYFEPNAAGKTLPEIGRCWVQINQNEANQKDRKYTCIDLPKSMQNPFKVESAFVKSEQVHRLLDYRATFARRNGRWELASFLAGD